MTYRIRIVGDSGKTSLAIKLGQFLQIPTVIHLDDLFFFSDWRMKSDEEFKAAVLQKIRDKDNWIVDGNYKRLGDALTAQITHVIIMHPPLYLSLWRLFIREIIRRMPRPLLPVTPAPRPVRGQPSPNGIWQSFVILSRSTIRAYTFRNRERYQSLQGNTPHIPIFCYRQHQFNQLREFLTQKEGASSI